MAQAAGDKIVSLRIEQFLEAFTPLLPVGAKCKYIQSDKKRFDICFLYPKFEDENELLCTLIALVHHVAKTDSIFIADLFQTTQTSKGVRPSGIRPKVDYGITNWINVVNFAVDNPKNLTFMDKVVRTKRQKHAEKLGKMCSIVTCKYANLFAFYLVVLYAAKGDKVKEPAILNRAQTYLHKYFPEDFSAPAGLTIDDCKIELDVDALGVREFSEFHFARKPSRGKLFLPVSPVDADVEEPIQINEDLNNYSNVVSKIDKLQRQRDAECEKYESSLTAVHMSQIELVTIESKTNELISLKNQMDLVKDIGQIVVDFAKEKRRPPFSMTQALFHLYESNEKLVAIAASTDTSLPVTLPSSKSAKSKGIISSLSGHTSHHLTSEKGISSGSTASCSSNKSDQIALNKKLLESTQSPSLPTTSPKPAKINAILANPNEHTTQNSASNMIVSSEPTTTKELCQVAQINKKASDIQSPVTDTTKVIGTVQTANGINESFNNSHGQTPNPNLDHPEIQIDQQAYPNVPEYQLSTNFMSQYLPCPYGDLPQYPNPQDDPSSLEDMSQYLLQSNDQSICSNAEANTSPNGLLNSHSPGDQPASAVPDRTAISNEDNRVETKGMVVSATKHKDNLNNFIGQTADSFSAEEHVSPRGDKTQHLHDEQRKDSLTGTSSCVTGHGRQPEQTISFESDKGSNEGEEADSEVETASKDNEGNSEYSDSQDSSDRFAAKKDWSPANSQLTPPNQTTQESNLVTGSGPNTQSLPRQRLESHSGNHFSWDNISSPIHENRATTSPVDERGSSSSSSYSSERRYRPYRKFADSKKRSRI